MYRFFIKKNEFFLHFARFFVTSQREISFDDIDSNTLGCRSWLSFCCWQALVAGRENVVQERLPMRTV